MTSFWKVLCITAMLLVAAEVQNMVTADDTAAPRVLADPQQPDLVRKGLRLWEIPVHDPWILAHAETKTYYLYTAARPQIVGTNRSGTVTYKSKDLQNWEGPYIVFMVPDGTWANPTQGAWAPEVHRYNDRFYLFVTLHNSDRVIDRPPDAWRITHMRGTIIAVADSPEGPFVMLKTNAPVPPADFMTLDGTLYIEDGEPWMVYAHEWVQIIDGTMEAIPLKPDLSDAAARPIHLFKASDAPWINAQRKPSKRENHYVTDGPALFRTKTGQLLMLWSSYDKDGYVQTVARSQSGKLAGPWEQLQPLVRGDSGHGMLFRTFEGQLMMVLHQPFGHNARAKLYDMEDTGDNLRVVRPREDLHGQTQAN